ncbi:hypothetical protein G7068_08135 [Leucobacter viscericola]|uniref:Cytochrome b561 bacterial/Ni-hydrogenase domain-containing protein n=1 Tax=Leucobacter viscericola TaxID=2714935 RepID=A0A6G7XFL2_9MICO|nr:cytochrome b/b6 domain-containing protein [Leucobacter viscericola]QIK63168.1 hypothetical protein G7068_08135 [Leucobacter viscericola]
MSDHGTRSRFTDRVAAYVQPRADSLQRALGSPVRNTRMTVVLGRILGVALLVCFATGLYSHLLQSPVGWLVTSPEPSYLYAWTQGSHVVIGSMLIPLVLAKLWTVYPRLFKWPPVTGPVNFLERVSVAAMVACALIVPVSGVLNELQWYPWEFSFRRTHFALSWVLIGAMVLHISVHLPSICKHWRRQVSEMAEAETAEAGMEKSQMDKAQANEAQGVRNDKQ